MGITAVLFMMFFWAIIFLLIVLSSSFRAQFEYWILQRFGDAVEKVVFEESRERQLAKTLLAWGSVLFWIVAFAELFFEPKSGTYAAVAGSLLLIRVLMGDSVFTPRSRE